jgi:uncharacterized protein (TIGR03083 family)
MTTSDVDTGVPGVPRLAEGLRAHTAAFARALEGADPTTRVPTCPEWRVRDLVAHIGQAHRWAAELVRSREPGTVPDPRDVEPGPREGWSGWLLEGAEDLIAAVEVTGADTAVWTVLGQRPAAFWLRRILNDASVHLADATLLGGTEFEIAPDLAADAIREGLEILSAPGLEAFRPDLAGLNGRGETIVLRAVGRRGGWRITRTPDGVRWERLTADGDTGQGAVVDGDVVMHGSVRDLLLVFTRRVTVDESAVTVTGDRRILDHWLANTVF